MSDLTLRAKLQRLAEREPLQYSLDLTRRLEKENKRMDQYMRTFLEQIEGCAIFAMDSEC